jgi:histidinol phosphatase-like PHP family hydrolase
MARVKISENAFLYPMPMVAVGTLVENRPNFMAVGWVSRVNYQPPMIAVALGKTHHTNGGIHATQAFSVNITGIDLIPADFLCHLDVIWRNYPEIETNSEIEAKFQTILKKVKRHNMALEINTSGFEQRGEQYPGNILLSRARALEIPFVVGSDSHAPEQVGRHFEKVQAWFE